jgi:UDP:flavonoid glycosyltransferase YjiC (YdhE family)
MRILFSGHPLVGHILPMMPIADAARAAGQDTALLTSSDLASLVAQMHVLPAGPSAEDMIGETVRRTGSHPAQPGPAAVELFAGVHVDLSFDEALRQAHAFGPELIVCEQFDFVGPMVAAALGIPWAMHGISGAIPDALWHAMQERAARQYESRSLTPMPRIAFVDPYPDLLRSPTERPAEDRIAVRPGANEHGPAQPAEPIFEPERPCALVTVGTMVNDSVALSVLASSVAASGFAAIVTAEAEYLSDEIDRHRVQPVGFVPLARLLPKVDVVVTAGGTGTVLAALSHSLPMVIRPFVADQPWNAARIADIGAGIVIDDVAEAGRAARRIHEDPAYREAATSVAAELASMNSPDAVLRRLMSRCGRAAA